VTAAKRFVVGLDGSDESRRALRWAVDEAAEWDAELDVVHAWDLPLPIVPTPVDLINPADIDALEASARAVIDTEVAAAVGRDESRVHIETILVRDAAAGALLEVSKGADLLVVGSRGRGGFAGLLLGSVSSKCVHHASCSVAVIRGEHRETTGLSRPGHLVVGVDGSESGGAALTWAIAEATRRRAPVVALAAWSWLDQPEDFDPNYGVADVKAMAEAAVDRARGSVVGADVDVEIRPINDHAGHALVEASADAELLVVGSRGLGSFRGLLLGSVSSQCVHHAHCPVVVVR
jgi:nucleotide-binding universal stress UspA family protein